MDTPALNLSLDTLGMLSSIKQFPQQCSQVIKETAQLSLPEDYSQVHSIVISGMGGSALGGRIISSLERQTLKIPIVVSTEYHLPNFVDQNSLVVVSSYSGNTEETLSSLAEARARGSKILIIASGGKLAQIASEEKIPAYIFNPEHNPCGQPRIGLGYAIVALATLLSRCHLISPLENLGQLPEYLTDRQTSFPDLVKLAGQMSGKIPVLISSEHLKGAAHAVKNMINENSKNFAVIFDIPELNHHLMEGLAYPKSNPQNLFFLFLTSMKYHPEVLKRYPLTQDVVNKQKLPYLTYEVNGPTRFFETMQLIQEGSYLAFSLALINGIDPGPIPWVDYFKDTISHS